MIAYYRVDTVCRVPAEVIQVAGRIRSAGQNREPA